MPVVGVLAKPIYLNPYNSTPIFRIFKVAKSFIMVKHLPPPNYYRIMALLGAGLLVVGMGLLVAHMTDNRTYFIAYSGVVFLLLGGAGMIFFKPRS